MYNLYKIILNIRRCFMCDHCLRYDTIR